MKKLILILIIIPLLLSAKDFDFEKNLLGIKPGNLWQSAKINFDKDRIEYESVPSKNVDVIDTSIYLSNPINFLGKNVKMDISVRGMNDDVIGTQPGYIKYISLDIDNHDLKYFIKEFKKISNKYKKKRDKRIYEKTLLWDSIDHIFYFDNTTVTVNEDIKKGKNHETQHYIFINAQ